MSINNASCAQGAVISGVHYVVAAPWRGVLLAALIGSACATYYTYVKPYTPDCVGQKVPVVQPRNSISFNTTEGPVDLTVANKPAPKEVCVIAPVTQGQVLRYEAPGAAGNAH